MSGRYYSFFLIINLAFFGSKSFIFSMNEKPALLKELQNNLIAQDFANFRKNLFSLRSQWGNLCEDLAPLLSVLKSIKLEPNFLKAVYYEIIVNIVDIFCKNEQGDYIVFEALKLPSQPIKDLVNAKIITRIKGFLDKLEDVSLDIDNNELVTLLTNIKDNLALDSVTLENDIVIARAHSVDKSFSHIKRSLIKHHFIYSNDFDTRVEDAVLLKYIMDASGRSNAKKLNKFLIKLLKSLPHINQKNMVGNTILIEVIRRAPIAYLFPLVNKIIELGVDVNQVAEMGETPLIVALKRLPDDQDLLNGPVTQVIKFLLEHNADPNIQDIHGTTALMRAVRLTNVPERESAIRVLLSHAKSIDKNLTDIEGRTALNLAMEFRFFSRYVVESIQKYQPIRVSFPRNDQITILTHLANSLNSLANR